MNSNTRSFDLGGIPTLPSDSSARPQVYCGSHYADASSASQRDIISDRLRIRFQKSVQPSASVEKAERCRGAGNFQAMLRDALRDAAAA